MANMNLLWWMVGFLTFITLIVYVLCGNTKEKLWKIALVIAVTFVLFRYVADPLASVCEDKFLGPLHKNKTYDGERYKVDDIVSIAVAENGTDYKLLNSGVPRVVLTDNEKGEELISEDDSCSHIRLEMYDNILVVECDYFGSKPSTRYLLDDGILKEIEAGEGRFTQLWRGNIIKYRKEVGDEKYEDAYERTDGKPLSFIQKLLVDDRTPNFCLLLIFIFSLVFTVWLTKSQKEGKQSSSTQQ